jgi:hypothetical protein
MIPTHAVSLHHSAKREAAPFKECESFAPLDKRDSPPHEMIRALPSDCKLKLCANLLPTRGVLCVFRFFHFLKNRDYAFRVYSQQPWMAPAEGGSCEGHEARSLFLKNFKNRKTHKTLQFARKN